MRSLASDNHSGVHPRVLEAINAANADHAISYGADPWTTRALELIRGAFGTQAEVFSVFNGTGANVIGMQSMLRTWESIICATTAHVNVDEAGAPEKLLGSKVIPVPSTDAKITPDLIRAQHWGIGDFHPAQPRVVLVTQSTEYGTRYSLDELRAITSTAHELDMFVYLDGARIANAAAGLGCTFKEMTTDIGIDALSFGATKNGAMGAEAVVVLNPALKAGETLGYIRKQYMQLASKMRFVSAQFIALLEDDLWRDNAEHSNAMAQYLATQVTGIPGVSITQAVEANAVFAIIPAAMTSALQEVTPFYVWNEATNEVRWMCSWDTTTDDIDAFVGALTALTAGNGA
ncbi:MAG: threonine aldolase family protein [Candidatus Nanopelagicales bacterium]